MELPIEYTMPSKYDAAKLVEQRIKDALSQVGIEGASFSVKIIKTDYKFFTTRVYAGGWLWGRRGTNKSFISSKRDQAIDMERVIEFIKEKHDEIQAGKRAYEEKEVREKRSKDVADALAKKLGVPEYGRLSILGGSDDDHVLVRFSKTLTIEEAEAVAKLLMPYSN